MLLKIESWSVLLKIGTWFELDTENGLFIRCWRFGQFHWSRLGFFADRWATVRKELAGQL